MTVQAQGSDLAGSCNDLVDSVPSSFDGGFFDSMKAGDFVETG